MDDARFEELIRLEKEATPGPWLATGEKQDNPLTGDFDGCRSWSIVAGPDEYELIRLGPCGGCEGSCTRKVEGPCVLDVLRPTEDLDALNSGCYPHLNTPNNAHFIAVARQAVPELLEEVLRLKCMYLELLAVADRHVPINQMPDSADDARCWRLLPATR